MTEATELKPNQWRKKPVVITAVQLNTIEDARAYHPPVCQGGLTCKSKGAPDGAWPHIHTLEGDHTWREGDWCITGVNGEHYFCKPDIFAKTYEPSHMQAGASLTAAQNAGSVLRYRHVKRGTVYEVVGEAELQIANTRYTPNEGDVLIVYCGEDGKLWCREKDEFHDGRFAAITQAQEPE